MSKIEQLELELFDAEVHLDNCKANLQLNGATWANLNLYLDAYARVRSLREKLEYMQHTKKWEWAGGDEPLLFSCPKGGQMLEKYGKKW